MTYHRHSRRHAAALPHFRSISRHLPRTMIIVIFMLLTVLLSIWITLYLQAVPSLV